MCVPFLNETIDAGTYTSYTPGQTQTNLGFVGAFITIQVTAASGSMGVRLEFSPDGGSTWIAYDSAGVSISSTGNTVLIVYPGAGSNGANETVAAPLPQTWILFYQVNGGSSFTLSTFVNYMQ